MGQLLLVRHGQASFGTDDYDVLSPLGLTQGRRLGVHLRDQGIEPGVVLHGGMRRQRETAESLLAGAELDVAAEVDPCWAEFDHLSVIAAYAAVTESDLSDADRERLESGTLDRREFQRVFEKATARWVSENYDVDYAETYRDFTTRVRDGLARAARRSGPGKVSVVVTSGGPIAAACAMLTEVGEDARKVSGAWQRLNAVVVNASVTRVVVGSTGARLLTFNEHSFLGQDLVTYR